MILYASGVEIFGINVNFITILTIFILIGCLTLIGYLMILLIWFRRRKNDTKLKKTELQKQLNYIDDEIVSIIENIKQEKSQQQEERRV
ncbi:TIGR04561 family membrane protein [Mycoplasma cottewii]|uniref:TIGR04561 family membrane protein n=1 Tax=Mycoplasma cottewii TaxID=51364 RepID=A0ABY5U0P6_9MOLU|nr:TIGR04561 family membrane protein [Mycoplasma cottewii]UWD35376.1 TIGR04561 family membrane protein [Mycoplasma cottewii]